MFRSWFSLIAHWDERLAIFKFPVTDPGTHFARRCHSRPGNLDSHPSHDLPRDGGMPSMSCLFQGHEPIVAHPVSQHPVSLLRRDGFRAGAPWIIHSGSYKPVSEKVLLPELIVRPPIQGECVRSGWQYEPNRGVHSSLLGSYPVKRRWIFFFQIKEKIRLLCGVRYKLILLGGYCLQ